MYRKKIDLDLIKLLEFSFDEYIKQNLKIDIDLKIISDFFKKRIGVLFVEIGYKSELVDMMLSKDIINPFKLSKEIEILNTFINSNHGVNFLKAIKRMISINDARVSSLNPDPKKFKLKEENLLFECVEKLVNFRNSINFIQDKEFIISFTQNLNTFFDNVKVNVDDSLIQNNRKALIRLLCMIIEKFYKFSLIKILMMLTLKKIELSNFLEQIETHRTELNVIKNLDKMHSKPRAHVIGITGAPGVGKSSMIDKTIQFLRKKENLLELSLLILHQGILVAHY